MLKGTLDDFTLPDIFRLMSLAKKTGRMDVSRGAGTGRVFFNEGDVYYAESSLSREPLGQKLIRSRALTESQLNKALDMHSQTGKRVGDILIESGMVTGDQIEHAVAQQIEDAIFDLLRWDLGEFSWEAGASLEVEVPISVSVENLIMEASRRLDELEVIQRKIPGEHAILTMAATPPEGAAEINITPEEWRALVLVDGTRTVGEIGTLIGKDDFETMKILYGLVSAGLVEVDYEATAAGEQEAAAAIDEAALEDAVGDVQAEDAAVVEEEVFEQVPAEATAEEAIVELEEQPAEETFEPEIVTSEPAAEGAFEDLEGLLEDVPAAPDEARVDEGMAGEPEIEIVSAGGSSSDELDIAAETGVVGDEVVASSGFDMSADELLATPPGAGPEALDDVEVPAASNGAGDVLDMEPAAAAPDEAEPSEEDFPAEPTAETVSAGDADDPFLSDLLDQDSPVDAPDDVTAPTVGEGAPPEAPEPVAEEESPTVDRAAVVRELAGLFDEDRPKARASGPSAPPAPGAAGGGDQRKRVEDDDQINKGVISRLIKGVKGL